MTKPRGRCQANTRLRSTSPAEATHWPDIARLWAQVGPPLRPSDQDIGFFVEAISSRGNDAAPPRALILGVTPELHDLPWPIGTDLLALDHTRAMIEAVWPGPRNRVICAEWTDIPLQDGSRNVVLCDGGLHLLPYRPGQERLVQALCRIVALGGLCSFRLFVPPKQREEPRHVIDDLLAGKIANLNILKLRLAMSLQGSPDEGVALGDVWRKIYEIEGNLERLSSRIGWPFDHLAAIDTYRDSLNRYHFVGVREAESLFCERPGGFEVVDIKVPTYELGERCPTVIMRRTKHDSN